MSDAGSSRTGQLARSVQQRFGLPDTFKTVSPFPFQGMNVQASRWAIADSEFFWLENLIKLGDGNLRAVPDKGPGLYQLPGSDTRTMIKFAWFSIGLNDYAIMFFDDGSATVVHTDGTVTVVTATVDTFYRAGGAFPATVQWGTTYLLIANNNTANDYWAWDGTLLYTAGGLSPQVSLSSDGANYVSLPVITVFGGHGSGATLEPTVSNGSVVYLKVTNPGTGYLPGDIVQAAFFGGGSDTSAQLVAVLEPSSVNDVVILNGGTGYASAPTVTFTGGAGSGAAGTANVTGGVITSVTMTNPGSGYTSAPAIGFTPVSGGSGGIGQATLVAVGLLGINVVNGGTNFFGVPGLTIEGGFGGGAIATAVLSGPGPIESVTVPPGGGGDGYTSFPTVTITDGGSGTGATAVVTSIVGGVVQTIIVTAPGADYTSPVVAFSGGMPGTPAIATAAVGAGSIASVITVNPGSGYTDAPAVIVQAGLNSAAAATLPLMPFGISGTSIESYDSQVWIQNPFQIGPNPTGGVRTSSAPGSISDFATSDGGLSETVTDRFLRRYLSAIRQSNGFLYPMGDSSVGVISNVQVQGSPPTKTLTNQNTDPQTGTHWPDSIQDFSRTILLANQFGIFGLFGGAVTKISGKMDGIFQTALLPGGDQPVPEQPVTPSAAVANLYNRKVYLLLLNILDPFTQGYRPAMVCWNEQDWSLVSQSASLTFIGTQEINSNLIAWGTEGRSLFPLMQVPSTLTTKIMATKLYGAAQPYMTKRADMLYVQSINFGQPDRAPLLTPTIDTEYASFPANPPLPVFPPPGSPIPVANPAPVAAPLLAASTPDIPGQSLGFTLRSTEADFVIVNTMMATEDVGVIFG